MVKNIPNRINSSSDQSAVSNYDDALLNDILIGAVDLHCHCLLYTSDAADE